MISDYHPFHLNLLKVAYNNLLRQEPFCHEELSENDAQFQRQLTDLVQAVEQQSGDYIESGQQILSRLVRHYPELVPLLPRDLFWYFGGECLHFMPDDEIEIFQRLDEQRYEAESAGEPFHYEEARAHILGLH
ncbi:PA2817 family protein [Marinobacterium aestuariivivens]|uniref:PA2817 family protein n=1 Tax=Marinobacterium aestuariivivens TaxID=1698799 RepID=A0ABW1ZV66_9GAMM